MWYESIKSNQWFSYIYLSFLYSVHAREKISSEHYYTSTEELLDQGSGTWKQSYIGEDIFHLNFEQISIKDTGTKIIPEYC